jgi:choline monooxygenase
MDDDSRGLTPIEQIVGRYRADTPLAYASTIPAAWYIDRRVLDLEQRTVFRRSWQVAGHAADLRAPGDYIACELPGGEPIVIARGTDGVLRAFYNVCRHHAAAVVADPWGSAQQFRCPYHGWTYGLDGALKGTPDFADVCDFDRSAHGLIPIDCDAAEQWVWVRLERDGVPLASFLGPDLTTHLAGRGLGALHWTARRRYTLDCNWKVFVDNYLDGGYHVPHVHRGLDSVLSAREYTIETGERFCLQWSPMVKDGADERSTTGSIRTS